MSVVHSAFGYITLLTCAWLLGKRSRQIPWKTLGIASLFQVVLTALLLLTGIRDPIFTAVSALTLLLKTTALKAGESLLFAGLTKPEFARDYGVVFAIEIASVLIFVAALSRLLYHYRVLPWLIGGLSSLLQRLMGISAAEGVGVAANIILGMTEAPLLIRPYISRLTQSELFCLMTAGMATIAGTVMVIYATMLQGVSPDIAGHLFVASLISAPAAIAVAKLMIPEEEQPQTVGRHVHIAKEDTINGLDAAARGALEGVQLFINIVAMLIAFIGLVALVNTLLGALGSWINGGSAATWSLQAVAGYLFWLPSWLMGIPWNEARVVGELMGLKTILNEFVAYLELVGRMGGQEPLSQRSFIIASYALCGFANFGSVAIMIGGIGGIAPERRGDLARLGLRSLVAGSVATMLTGCVVGLYL